ncbi:tyrosine--tRNA ligase [Candidatus Gottesmanbacteria bacterium RIFCSPLOWO2_01_FULL_39_12b]|uniref:Tyrosine--tRNA ligase n=1 Tax=Candidatus Gottesmanbacteria bacterium RIFCSPLOWO2_01_FULL_39_12b TaxID=1798388 RepID=A0A1F6AR08_9BACT|nr:MAG: tyrosine--tRNA ligase [Candidatus Gottesmanbacteria bacterium RIFCSPLOWO2_01_FULL_39_12b]
MDKIDEILTRGVVNIIPDKDRLKKLLTSRSKLNIYLGIDPTATKIHLGHAVPLRKLQTFADFGHKVTFLIGDFTALIGDTSDKDSERPVLTTQQIENNFKTYKKQAQKILDFTKIEVKYNSEWLVKLQFADIVKLCQHFSAGDFVSRELIRKRLESGKKVGLHELLYPVMQGYDSYYMNTDIQLGGSDQTFNMQAGRVLQQDLRNKESYIIANSFLDGTDGRKMSKTWDNAVWLDDLPDNMFGKIMSLHDELIIQYFSLGTNVSLDKVKEVENRLKSRENPMILKKELANEVVRELHGGEKAIKSQKNFELMFQKRKPSLVNIPSISMEKLPIESTYSQFLLTAKLVKSRGEAKRLILQKAVEHNDKLVVGDTVPKFKKQDIIKVGKKNFIKIV